MRVDSGLAKAAHAIEVLCLPERPDRPTLDLHRLIRNLTAGQIPMGDEVGVSDRGEIQSILSAGRFLVDDVLPFAGSVVHPARFEDGFERVEERREKQFDKRLRALVEEDDAALREKKLRSMRASLSSRKLHRAVALNLDRAAEEAFVPVELLVEAANLLLGCTEEDLGFVLRLGEHLSADEYVQDASLIVAAERGERFKRELTSLVEGLERQRKLQADLQEEEFGGRVEYCREDRTLRVSSRGRPFLGRVIAANVYDYLLNVVPARYRTESSAARKFNATALELAVGLVNKTLLHTKALPKRLATAQVRGTHRSRFQ